MARIELVAWDIEGTLIPKNFTFTREGQRIVRTSAVELLKLERLLELNPNIEEALAKIKNKGIKQGIISNCAYQNGTNLLLSSRAIDYIHPGLIYLAHSLAWQEAVLENKPYEPAIEKYAKPSRAMFDLAVKKVSEINRRQVESGGCAFVGDDTKDRDGAINSGWRYFPVEEISSLLEEV